MMISWKRFIFACLAGALVTAILSSIISTQRIIGASMPLSETYAAQMTLSTRLSNTFADLTSFAPLLMVFVFLAFLSAMGAALFFAGKKPNLTLPLILGAGFTGIIVMLSAMKLAFFGVDIVAGARDWTGYLLLGLAGAIGAFVFYRVYRRAIPNKI